MGVKQVFRIVLIVVMAASISMLVTGNIYPIFRQSAPRAQFSSWQNCKTSGGFYGCYVKFSSPAANADCSDMDNRTTTVAVFSIIWILASVHTILVLLWEMCGGVVPQRNIYWLLCGWTAVLGILLSVVLAQTLIASLCNSPLTFSDQTGTLELGGILICAAAGASGLGWLGFFLAPDDDFVSNKTEQSLRTAAQPSRRSGEGESSPP